MESGMNRQSDHLGVNKMGRNIKKSPVQVQQPNFGNAGARQQPQPQVYNINKNDFRSIVQQLTGSPLRDHTPPPPYPQPPPRPRPPQNHHKPPNNRLHRVRPPPLAQTTRPHLPIPYIQQQQQPWAPNNFARPPPPHDQLHSPNMILLPPTPTDVWSNTTDSPISAYMRYLQNSIIDGSQPQSQSHLLQPQPYLLPNPVMLPTRTNGGPPPPLLPSPTSQFLLPSPTGFLNLLSPRSPYPLLSPGYQQHPPPPISPNFSFSSVGQSGILGPGPHPPPSPGYGFPLSPSGFFPLISPGWRNQ